MLRMLKYAAVMLLMSSPAIAQEAALADAISKSANPDLIGALSKEMGGATVAQATGAAGALLSHAKTKLKPEDFAKVSGAIPGIDSILGAAPAVAGTSGAAGAVGAATGAASALGGLAGIAPAFDKLGLKPDMVMKAVPVLTNYVTKAGGKDVGALLAGVLK